jgi:excinuclease UvrABC nuclease subunit
MPFGRKPIAHLWLGPKIIQRAPRASGVYGIFNKEGWIYVGATGNLRAALLGHFDGNNACIKKSAPMGFQFERVPAKERAKRKRELIEELNPNCNRG